MLGNFLQPISLLLLVISVTLCIAKSNIRYLPGFEGPLPFKLATGYIGVEDDNAQLFYYFVKSDNNPKKDPILLWLTGGPVCSGFTAFAYEIGPVNFVVSEYNGSLPTLKVNPYSWTKVANVIFVDAPVGTGFSYSKGAKPSTIGDMRSSRQAYQFLLNWLIEHPEFLSNLIYIGGDSYSGMIIPVVLQYISDGNEAGNKPFINLKGYLLGNGITMPDVEGNSAILLAHGLGLLSEKLYKSLAVSCGGQYRNVNPSNKRCLAALQDYHKCTSGINFNHILEPKCTFASPRPIYKRSLAENENLTEFHQDPKLHLQFNLPPNVPEFKCRNFGYTLAYYWADDKRVREVLQIKRDTIPEWIRCNSYGLHYNYEIQSTFQYHVNLSKRGYRSLIYNGDHDMIVPHLSAQEWIQNLNYSIIDEWRPWIVEGQVGGYTRIYSNNMTFATVLGGGHTAPQYRPKECYAMFKRWISEKPL